MKKILVTGGTGFIGSHTVVELQQHGYEVVIVDDLSNSSVEVLDQIRKITGIRPAFEQFDLVDRERTADFFARHEQLSGIIHFAAFKAAGESMEKPLEYYRNNVVSLLNILDGMKMHGIRDIVFSSSCTVYGQPDQLPVTEDAPFKTAWSPYGNTKQICEDILRFNTLLLPIRVIALRYFNPIGAHDSALIGELPLGVPNNLVPFITQTAIGKRECLSVFGNDYDTPDGTAIRDYIHVVDLARAHVVAVERMIQGNCLHNLEVFNLGTGIGFTVMEVIQSFERVSGVKLNYRIAPRRAGDVEKVWADTRLANETLGWKAVHSLDEMMLSAWNWEKALAKGVG
ncbi:MAG TPA: UDP-glucose 4-epimerase GalE [Bacteroidales bacterium]|nr:UDP-glucose 4-epimerase GalE [Bacteroidales bacterium]HRZ21456.1 UDP-glucose 4-epimerase GalE [Bacteroidales bacterium]